MQEIFDDVFSFTARKNFRKRSLDDFFSISVGDLLTLSSSQIEFDNNLIRITNGFTKINLPNKEKCVKMKLKWNAKNTYVIATVGRKVRRSDEVIIKWRIVTWLWIYKNQLIKRLALTNNFHCKSWNEAENNWNNFRYFYAEKEPNFLIFLLLFLFSLFLFHVNPQWTKSFFCYIITKL